MREDEFRAWLRAKGITTVSNRMSLVRRVERSLAALGCASGSLDDAHRHDGLRALTTAVADLGRTTLPGQPVPGLLPNGSSNPAGRLSTFAAALRNYRQFADGAAPPPNPEHEPDDDDGEDVDLAREAVEAAMDECDRVGEARFLLAHRPGACGHRVLRGAASYPAGAVAARGRLLDGGAAAGEGADGGCGTAASACGLLDALGYRVVGAPSAPAALPETGVAPRPTTRPTNLILYGPPGTGKTYATAAEAVRLCLGAAPDDRAALMRDYARLAEAGRIEFVTFHQSYGYEDFVEGLRPRRASGGDGAAAGFELHPEPGAFKRIARRAEAASAGGRGAFRVGDRRAFKLSMGAGPGGDRLFEEALRTGYALLGWGGEVDWSDEQFASREAMIEAWQSDPTDRPPSGQGGHVRYSFILRNRVREGDLIVVSKGNGLFRAVGVVAGGYEHGPREGGEGAHRRRVNWLWHDHAGAPAEEAYARGFPAGAIHELDRAELRAAALERRVAAGGRGGAEAAPDQFVLVIDEINRANISKVFGELITLIEPDKRLGCENALSATLPSSREPFGVPANLHIIGTMNTADRSVAPLDAALRRRFEFRELMPDPDALAADLDGVPLRRLLAALNARIEYLSDREHQVGHAFFMACRTRADVDHAMRAKVIPLLQEYFHDDWAKVALVLGDAAAPPGEGAFIAREPLAPPPGLEAGDGADPRWRWRVRDPFGPDAYERFG